MDAVWFEYIPWVYASIQGIVTLVVSIIGAKYVRNEFLLQKSTVKQQTELTVNMNTKFNSNDQQTIQSEFKDMEQQKVEIGSSQSETVSEEFKMMSKMGFCKLWFKIIWKLRGVYSSLIVHSFDVLTDILVIISWFSFPDVSGDNIDPRVMAYSALGVLAVHKLISFIAFWAKERSIVRCLLQVLDLLIFEEIFVTHKKIITQFRIRANKDHYEEEKGAIETTSTFKYVRNLEAVFESIPQSILQLVFIVRTGWESEGSGVILFISIASIIQSIISMTNSILANDNVYMSLPKWKKHKQRLPPTLSFIRHAISRLSEVVYRICLCALFWVVCGGLPFAILIVVELLFLMIIVYLFDVVSGDGLSSVDDIFLRIQMIIIMPSELVYATRADVKDRGGDGWGANMRRYCCMGSICMVCTCFIGPATCLSSCCFTREFYMHMSARIGISMMEWILMIIWPIYIDKDAFEFLHSFDHGLYVFIVSILSYLTYSQYVLLFPDFKLPFGVAVRSIYGYAFTGELEDLQRVASPAKYTFQFAEDDNPKESIFPNIELNGRFEDQVKQILQFAFYGQLEKLKWVAQEWMDKSQQIEKREERVMYQILMEHCWDVSIAIDGTYNIEATHNYPWITPAILALSNKQYHVVTWLEEEREAKIHREIFLRQRLWSSIERNHLFARGHIEGWRASYKDSEHGTCLMLALSNKQYHVVEWLLRETNVLVPEGFKDEDINNYLSGRKLIGDSFFD